MSLPNAATPEPSEPSEDHSPPPADRPGLQPTGPYHPSPPGPSLPLGSRRLQTPTRTQIRADSRRLPRQHWPAPVLAWSAAAKLAITWRAAAGGSGGSRGRGRLCRVGGGAHIKSGRKAVLKSRPEPVRAVHTASSPLGRRARHHSSAILCLQLTTPLPSPL